MSHTFSSLWYHLVWSTKNRDSFLEKELRTKLFIEIKAYCKKKEYHLDQINGVEDHIHLLISLKPSVRISDVVRNIKTHSYYWLKENELSTSEFGWQDSYAVFTVSERFLKNLRSYIQNQEIHHKNSNFETEIKELEKIYT